MSSRIGRGEFGMHCVDLDGGVAQFICELHRHHVHGCLGTAVAQHLVFSEHPGGVTVQREGSHAARQTYDPSGLHLPDQRQHGFGDSQGAKKVDIEDSTHRVKVCTAWRTIISVHDACVIHQNIEASVLRSYPLRCCRNCFFFQEVEWNRIDIDSLASEHCSRCFPLLRITRTQQDSHTGAAQLPRDLKSNALVCASN